MNNAATPTEPADPDPNPAGRQHRAEQDDSQQRSSASPAAPASTQAPDDAATGSATQQLPALSQKAKAGLAKKLAFLMHLNMSLDTLIYAELCILYYMDCSFIRLIIRWAPHWLYLSPKSENLTLVIPNYPVGAILGPNAVCILLHLVSSLPHAGEANRGYLHGGILIDFVGQTPPSSKLTLLLLDLVVLGLQCFMLSVSMEKDRIKKIVKPPKQQTNAEGTTATNVTSTATNTATTANTGQDHDAEERGVLRDAPTIDETDAIEMRPMGAQHDAVNDEENAQEGTSLLDRGSSRADNSSYEELGDVLSSGNAVLSDFHVRHALRTAYNETGNTVENAGALALQNVGYNATLAALAAQRRARLATAQASVQARQP